MILTGTLPGGAVRRAGEVAVALSVDTSQFVEQIVRAARSLMRLEFEVEVRGLKPHQIDALMYVRGSSHEYADPDARDLYVRAMLDNHEVGHLAAAAFLSGWCRFRSEAGAPAPLLAWHRLLGDQPVEVSGRASGESRAEELER